MSFEDVLHRVFDCEKFENANCTAILTGEKMATMRKYDLTARFDIRNVIVLHKSLLWWLVVLEHIHETDLVSKTNHYLEARWMERHAEGLVLVLFIYFEIESVAVGGITPNFHSFVH